MTGWDGYDALFHLKDQIPAQRLYNLTFFFKDRNQKYIHTYIHAHDLSLEHGSNYTRTQSEDYLGKFF